MNNHIILISGLSGSGKTVALRALEDSGFFSMDNLPVPFALEIISRLIARGEHKIAVTLDARSGEDITQLPLTLSKLKENNWQAHFIFLDASDNDLIRRFSETRRPHPLSDGTLSILECISTERELLSGISDIGYRIDTTQITPNALRSRIKNYLNIDNNQLTLFFESFGFKHGIPQDADFVFDVRCIPNPFYDPKLRPQTGQDKDVIDFLENDLLAQKMFSDISHFIHNWTHAFIKDNRSTLTIAIGCTGGQHRSVYLADKLKNHFKTNFSVQVIHRELT
ncbi:MAG: RNase adapter RapZ [Betaproteobacteria bacterium]|nr:RNase adapter RapZ [Betaproteobacteria bacterium]MDE2423341.1 RNase adapter RapZ [Betaproteobacteria bacterium]